MKKLEVGRRAEGISTGEVERPKTKDGGKNYDNQ